MNKRSSVPLALGFGILIMLIAGLGVGAIQRASIMYAELTTSQDSYLKTEALCRGIATDMYSAGVLVRDYLLDPDPGKLAAHRSELIEKRNSIQTQLDVLSARISSDQKSRLDQLQIEAQAYWDSLDPIFEWTPREKAEQSWVFLARKVLPHRDAVVDLARELIVINNNTLEEERQRLNASQQSLRAFLLGMIIIAILLGMLVAGLTINRVSALEKAADKQRQKIEDTQNDLRRLSQRLVQLQEGERRALSRELHDQIGQTMTALGILFGGIEDLRSSNDEEKFRRRLDDMKRLNADAMRNIRDLAMGLRPSMLDDIGLEAALQWQGREFSRHTGVPCEVKVEGLFDALSDAHRTCIYRVVQEALTNCARHAKATSVVVSVSSEEGNVSVTVDDNGIGFDCSNNGQGGLGLLGMRERVQALDGTLNISSRLHGGTTVSVHIPVGVPA
jgi:signal transduction histidine kinase